MAPCTCSSRVRSSAASTTSSPAGPPWRPRPRSCAATATPRLGAPAAPPPIRSPSSWPATGRCRSHAVPEASAARRPPLPRCCRTSCRLGLALNAMLAQIEAAFAQRTASERRLRRFIADASHELRTPLTSIRGYSEMLRRGASESPSDAELARRRIEEESVRMSTLVDDMLLIARLDQGRPIDSRPVDLQVIARDAAADARAVAPQREIRLDAPERVLVAGDDTRLRQVVGNLVRNALVHTPSTTAVEIAVATPHGTAQLSVADHGPGLPAADRDRIFEPFYRAH